MSAGDAKIQPIYNCKHREYITLIDADGAPIAPSSPDTELDLDGVGFADAAAEMTEISAGDCYLDLAYTELAATVVTVRPKSTGALTRAFKLYPQRLPVLRSGTCQAGSAAGTIILDASASAKDGAYVGCYARASNNDPAGIQGEVRKIIGYVGSTKVATIAPNWDNTPTDATTFEILVPSDLSVVALLASAGEVVDEMETQMQADPTGFHVNVKEVNGTAQTAGDVAADTAAILLDTGTNGVVLAADAITAAKIADNAIATEHVKADAVTKIATGVSTQMGILKNAEFTFEFQMVDTAGDPATGKTVVEEVSKDGGAYGAAAGAFAEVSAGTYKMVAAAADMNANFITFKFTSAGCKTTFMSFKTGT